MQKRRRRSAAEWQGLIEQHEQSGISAFAFCQQQGLSSKTFYKHRRTLQAKTANHSAERFIKIHPNSTQATAIHTTAVLHYQHSRLHLPTGADATWVAQLMKALS